MGAPLGESASAHLRVCPECGAFHDERQALRRLVGSLGTVGAPPDFDFRLRARLAAARTNQGQRAPRRSFLASVPAISLAAAFALLVAGFVIYKQLGPRRPAVETVAQQPAQEKEEQQQESPAPRADRPGEQVADVGPIEKAEDENPAVVKGGQPTRSVAGVPSARRKMTAKAPQIITNDYAARGALETTAESGQPFGAVVELPVRPASQPVRISLDDRDGARRTVTLEPVVFGSQDFAGRSLSRAGAPQDIW